MIKILFLAANPEDTSRLRLDEEIRAIDQSLLLAKYREQFDLVQQWAVRISDLQGHLLRHKPDIVHMSGHGTIMSEIVLEDSSGNSRPVPDSALSSLFSALKDNIRCVVLNACYSEKQAQAIARQIDCVVGMSKAIGDASAISFATAFYQALGYGRDIETAFDLGCNQIHLEDLGEQDIPKLLALKSNPREIAFGSNADLTRMPDLHENEKQILRYLFRPDVHGILSGTEVLGSESHEEAKYYVERLVERGFVKRPPPPTAGNPFRPYTLKQKGREYVMQNGLNRNQ